jgi:hypothetical protein
VGSAKARAIRYNYFLWGLFGTVKLFLFAYSSWAVSYGKR